MQNPLPTKFLNRKVKLTNFKKATQNALSMFTKALNELHLVNQQIDIEEKIANDQINELALYNQNLATERAANEKIIEKIKAIVEV